MNTTVSRAARWTAVACLSLWLCACSTMDRSVDPAGKPTTDDTRPQVYYAGQEGMPLYPGPAVSGTPTVRLPLNEKLLRSKVERGFAYVTVARSGQTGWVENAKLIWKKKTPPVEAPAAPAAVPPPDEAAPPAAEKKSDTRPGYRPDASIFDAN